MSDIVCRTESKMEMNIPEAFAGFSLANTERCVFTHVLHVLGRKLKSDCIVPFIVTMMMIAELQNAI